LSSAELDDNDGHPQTETNNLPSHPATFLKFKIMEGFGDFSVVHRISVTGRHRDEDK
jgi:hypothetical protein